ncbi:MAG TPA: hypothetical protein VG370_16400 [Chloroflexota bacterium]|jgi:hypothetical protein|nr:hypothetical protein [Chloroflexota bacterium]
MVAPLGNVRPTGSPAPSSAARPQPAAGGFEAELQRATEALASATPAAPAAFDADPLAQIEAATQSMQRASGHINAARAYFRAGQPGQGSVDRRG